MLSSRPVELEVVRVVAQREDQGGPGGSDLTQLSGRLLPLLNEAMPHRLMPVLREFLQSEAQAVQVGVLLADYELSELRRLSPRPGEDLRRPVAGSAAGRCFTSQAVVVEPSTPTPMPASRRPSPLVADPAAAGAETVEAGSVEAMAGEAAEEGPGSTTVLVPLSLRAERLGVLEVVFEAGVTAELLRGLQEVALATTYVLVACGACSDLVELARRAEPLSVAAEMQWNLQPLRAFAGREFSVAGQLIPAYEVGGDCFDYNVDVEHLDLSSLDAMGHGVRASVLAALATAVMRNVRRAGGGPVQQLAEADRQLLEQYDGEQFVTAVAMRLHLGSGQLDVVNAGHPTPWLVRSGQAEPLAVEPRLPMGMFQSTDYTHHRVQLQPGDRLVLVTDGLLEAGAPGEEFGEQRLAGLLLATADLTPHQAVAEALRTLRAFAPRLHDDATVVCLDWTGRPDTSGG